jgi:hypothetical protein
VPERSYVYDLREGTKKKKKKKQKPFPANFVSRKIIFLFLFREVGFQEENKNWNVSEKV